MDDLIIGDNQQYDLPPGMNKFAMLKFGKNSSIRFSSSVSILVKKLVSSEDSRFEYLSTAASPVDTIFTLNVIDASGVSGLNFIGNGFSPSGFQKGDRGPDGSRGSDAGGSSWSYPAGSDATAGGDAPPPASGPDGINAASFQVYLPFLNPGSKLYFSALGGNGGRGQDGGNGGRGGEGNSLKGPKGGGNAADGGRGGNGGNAGRVNLFLVIPADKVIDKDSTISSVNIKTDVAGGSGGLGGEKGLKGAGGGTKWGTTMPRGESGEQGSIGPSGLRGRDENTDPKGGWVDIDVMDFETYKALLAQQTFGTYTEMPGEKSSKFETFGLTGFTGEQVLWSHCESIDILGSSRRICASLIRSNLSLLVSRRRWKFN